MVLRHVLADRRHGCSRICCPAHPLWQCNLFPLEQDCLGTQSHVLFLPWSSFSLITCLHSQGAFLGWITFACMRGIGDVIDMLLSAPIWIPLARMTYSAYLVHPVVLTAYFAAVQNPFHLDGPNILFVYAGAVFISYATAAVLVLFVEMPFGNLEKLAFGA
eukprot:m.377058 g.377058  ORF g.377058 m.377058 type:complete len:161 (-) comp56191_c0_seq23:75-557(-)